MSAQEELKKADESAVDNTQAESPSGYSTSVVGKNNATKSTSGAKKTLKRTAPLWIIIAGVVMIGVFLNGNLQIDWFSTRLEEATNTMYYDQRQSQELVFQNALENGKIPTNTFQRLQDAGVTVGYLDGETFIASNVGKALVADSSDSIYVYGKDYGKDHELSPLSLKMGDKIIPANEFYYEVNHNIELYDKFTSVTYGRSGYYYDPKARQIFEKLGISLNVYTEEESLEDSMDNKVLGTKNIVGFNDYTWHYMPTYHASAECAPVLNPASMWDKVTDTFNCTGTNTTQIATWRVEKFHEECEPTGFVDENGIPICVPVCVSDGYTYFYSDYGCNGTDTKSYMKAMAQANMSKGDDIQTIKNTTDALKAADTLSTSQKSMSLYAGYMQSIGRTKAGYGSTYTDADGIVAAFATLATTVGGSHINDVMNDLFEVKESEVVDVKTGKVKILKGSMLEAPSLYSLLTGERVDLEQVADFSSDRILFTVGNANPDYVVDDATILRTAASKESSKESTVGRYTPNPDELDENKQRKEQRDYTPYGPKIVGEQEKNYNHGTYSDSDIGLTETTLKNSLYGTYEDFGGIIGGQMLAYGAVDLATELSKGSGAASGDEEAVVSYLKLTEDLIAMDAEVDRRHRSPLDITSKNTFLGSLVYKFAVSSLKSGSLLNKVASFSRMTNKAVASILPAAFADEESDSYLATFGDCPTLNTIGAAGSPTCSAIATFDTSTYTASRDVASSYIVTNDVQKNTPTIYNSVEFQEFIKKNTDCNKENICTIDDAEILAKYIGENENRSTPYGLTDATITEFEKEWAEKNEKKNSNWFKRIISFFKSLFGIIETIDNGEAPDEATGKEFVYKASNSVASNSDEENTWEKYKYAQRYISLARAAEAMRQFDGDETAYVFDGFGLGDPVARYIDELNQTDFATKY
ncbi:hypothetical protein IKT18_00215 [Candidatus Saccharibacteria bacterium]|nr:hypothetical protein [Candidatus Saccharibacteria bacterium]